MKVIKQKKIEGCLEGTNVKDFLFNNNITRDFIIHLGKLGKLIFTEDIEKPFFRIIVRGKYTLKGSLGNKTIRVLLPEKGDKELIDKLKEYVEEF
ncbi:hypothetical protein ACFLSQ_02230 [Bacteroidota bacterium]